MISRFFILILALICLCQNSCAHKESLQLQSVLDYETRRLERLKAEETARVSGEKVEAVPSPSPPPSAPVSPSGLQPAELSELPLPSDFILMKEEELKDPAFREAYAEIFPGITAGWKAKRGDAMILASSLRLDREELSFSLRKDFVLDIEKTGRQYDVFYQNKYKASSTSEVTDEEGLVTLKVTSKYVKDNVWRAETRYFYFYNPDYRLNLLVTGKDADLAANSKDLEESLRSFARKLRLNHVRSIDFQKEVVLTPPSPSPSPSPAASS